MERLCYFDGYVNRNVHVYIYLMYSKMKVYYDDEVSFKF